MTIERIPVDELSLAVWDTTSHYIQWSDAKGDDEEGWRHWDTFTYEDTDGSAPVDYQLVDYDGCTGWVIVDGEPAALPDEIPGMSPELRSKLEDVEPYMWGSEGPMMNYWYPIGDADMSVGAYGKGLDTPAQAAVALGSVPLCLVQVDEKFGLALTGGGMDLTWEIVEAFTLLGYLPPLGFCSLPGMAGRGDDERDRYLVAAVERSLSSAVERFTHQLENHRARWVLGTEAQL